MSSIEKNAIPLTVSNYKIVRTCVSILLLRIIVFVDVSFLFVNDVPKILFGKTKFPKPYTEFILVVLNNTICNNHNNNIVSTYFFCFGCRLCCSADNDTSDLATFRSSITMMIVSTAML